MSSFSLLSYKLYILHARNIPVSWKSSNVVELEKMAYSSADNNQVEHSVHQAAGGCLTGDKLKWEL